MRVMRITKKKTHYDDKDLGGCAKWHTINNVKIARNIKDP